MKPIEVILSLGKIVVAILFVYVLISVQATIIDNQRLMLQSEAQQVKNQEAVLDRCIRQEP